MSRGICKKSSKMYHFLHKIQNLPEMNQEFSYIFYTFLKNLPEMEEKSPSFHFQTHHMYVNILMICTTVLPKMQLIATASMWISGIISSTRMRIASAD